MRIVAKPYVPGTAVGRVVYWWQNITDLSEFVVVLRDISPEEMFDLAGRCPAAVVVIGYRYFSHILIYLFSREIPVVMVNASDAPLEGDWCFLNGASGRLECSKRMMEVPDVGSDTAGPFEKTQASLLAKGIVTTLDGHEIIVEASVSDADGALHAREFGVASIGLVRSEFLGSPGKTPPTKDEYIQLAQKVFDAAGILPVSWRLLDIGGEKIFPWMRATAALRDTLGIRGCRAYRLTIVRKVLQAQLQALAAIDAQDRCTLLVPYVSSLEEFQQIRSESQVDLGTNQFKFGAMLETPSACLLASSIARSADLVAIGTNDLTQAFFGASRNCSEVAEYIDPYAPTIVRFLSLVADLQAGKNFRICGQFPLLPHVLEYLVGLGFRRFSLEPLVLASIVQRCARINVEKMEAVCEEMRVQEQSEDVLRCLTASPDL